MKESYSKEQVVDMMRRIYDLGYAQGKNEEVLSLTDNEDLFVEKSRLVSQALGFFDTYVPSEIRKEFSDLLPVGKLAKFHI